MDQGKKPIGRILLQQRAVSAGDLERALTEHDQGGRLASRLANQGTISDVEALKALSEQYGIPGIDLSQICLRLSDLELLPREIAEKHLILPVLSRDDRLFVAMGNPSERKVIDELEFVTGKKVYPYVALESALILAIEEAYVRKARGEDVYVGPNCPAEVMRRAGVEPEQRAPMRSGDSGPYSESNQGSAPPAFDAPGVVVDDAVNRVSRVDDVEDSGFGDVSRELSQITDLPEQWDTRPPPDGAATVLVVDDEADIRKMLKRLLVARGLRVLEADRGLLALKMVKEHAPDLIVLDAMLPEVHGFEIARRIRGSKRYGHIPIVMISAVYRGWRYAEDLKQSCGVQYYIEKPFKISDVLEAVEGSLASRERDPNASSPAELSAEAEQCLNAGVSAYKGGRLDEAIDQLKRGIGIDPLAFRLHFHLGLLYGKTGQVYEAISELETAVEINAHHFPAVKNLAILYQKAGFRNKAADTWGRALRLAPDEPTRQSIREHVMSLL